LNTHLCEVIRRFVAGCGIKPFAIIHDIIESIPVVLLVASVLICAYYCGVETVSGDGSKGDFP
jgi:hypothetical protein